MGLKFAILTRVNKHGQEENCVLIIDGDGSSWTNKSAWVHFSNFESVAESDRPTKHPKQPFELYVKDVEGGAQNFSTEALKPTFNFTEEALMAMEKAELVALMLQPRAFTRSDWSWEAAASIACVDDWSTIDGEGNRVMVKKSLTELDAQIIEV